MGKELDVETLDRDTAFKLRLEVYLRKNAMRVRELSKTPHKFDDYITERERIIISMVGNDCTISDKGKIVFP